MIATDFTKQGALHTDPKAAQQIKFTGYAFNYAFDYWRS